MPRWLGVDKPMIPIRGVRQLCELEMARNSALADIRVDAQTQDVYADFRKLWAELATKVPLQGSTC